MSEQDHRIQDQNTKSVPFLYKNNEHTETKIKNNTIYKCSNENEMLWPLFNKTEDLYTENYKKLTKEIWEDLNK